MDGLEQAISIIFNGSYCQQANANEWINSFILLQECWVAIMNIISGTHDERVRFFCANMLLTKIKTNVNELTEQQRHELATFLHNILSNHYTSNNNNSSSSKIFLNRMLMSYALLCIRSSNANNNCTGVNTYVLSAFNHVNTATESATILATEMLAILPSEIVNADDLMYEDRSAIEQYLLNVSDTVYKLVDSIASNHSTKMRIAAVKAGSEINNCYNQGNDDMLLSALKLLRAWIKQGLTFNNLYQEHQSSFCMMCSTLNCANYSLVKETCALLIEIISIQEFPRSVHRDDGILLLQTYIVQSASYFTRFLVSEDDIHADVSYEICNCLSSVACTEIELLSSVKGFNAQFFDIILGCMLLKPRKLATLMFDVWIALQDCSTDIKPQYLTKQVYFKLFEIIVHQCKYPFNCSKSVWRGSDADDLNAFRDYQYGLQDVTLICCYALQDEFFLSIQSAFAGDFAWNTLEVALFVIYIASDAIKSRVKSNSGNCLSMMLHITTCVMSISIDVLVMYPYLHTTICRYMGSITHLLVSHDSFTDMFIPAVKLLLHSLSTYAYTASAAGKALYQLCIKSIVVSHRNLLLVSPTTATGACAGACAGAGSNGDPFLFQLIKCTSDMLVRYRYTCSCNDDGDDGNDADDDQAISRDIDAVIKPYMQLIESNVRAIQLLPVEAAKLQIETLAMPLIHTLSIELQKSLQGNCIIDEKSIAIVLQFISQIIRYCDGFTCDMLNDTCTQLYPQLQLIQSNNLFVSYHHIVYSLFDVHSRLIACGIDQAMVHVPNVIDFILMVIHIRHKSSAAGVRCACVLVERLLDRDNATIQACLIHLTVSMTNIIDSILSGCGSSSSGSSSSTVGNGEVDVECVEEYYNFIYRTLRLSPHVVASTSASTIVNLCIVGMATFKEKGPIRNILQLLLSLCNPMTYKCMQYQLLFQTEVVKHGQMLSSQLLYIFDQGLSALWCNVTDTLYAFISCLCLDGKYGNECHQWLLAAITQPQVFAKIPMDRRRSVVTNLVRCVHVGNKKCYKALLQDVSKVAASEITYDALLVYDDNDDVL